MCDSNFTRFLLLCGLTEGQEELITNWVGKLAEKGLSKNGKYAILREAYNDLMHNNDKIPPLLKHWI